jgi:hypothetical protein
MSQASSPGRCCCPLSHIRCGGPSAVRTRRAANRAFSRPFVPLRQLTVFHFALASICSAAIDKISGTWCFRGFPRTLVIGQMSCTPTGYTLRCRGMPTTQASPRSVSPCRNGALSPYPASASTHPKRTLAANARSTSAKAISGLDRAVQCSIGTRARFKRDTLPVQLSGRKRRSATIIGTSPRASVSDTSVWQFAVLPRADAY